MGKQNEDQLLIEGPDRIILSTAVFYAKTGKNVSLYTRDIGILYLSKKNERHYQLQYKEYIPNGTFLKKIIIQILKTKVNHNQLPI